MKILLNRKPVRNQPWGGGAQFINTFVDIATQSGHQVTHKLEDDIDTFFIFNAHKDYENVSIEQAITYKINNKRAKILMRINDCDKRKNTDYVDEMYKSYSFFADAAVFVSNWIYNYYSAKEAVDERWTSFDSEKWQCDKNYVILNGVDKNIFKRDIGFTEKIAIVCHHWSDNENKNNQLNEFLDRFVAQHSNDFCFTYIGRTQSKLQHSRIIEPLHGQALGYELGRHSVYINNSHADPGPNSVTESIACGLPTYANVSGGGAAEFVGTDHTFRDFDELEKLLLSKKFVQNSFVPDTWETCISKYLQVIESL